MYLFKGLLYSFHLGTCSSFRPLETEANLCLLCNYHSYSYFHHCELNQAEGLCLFCSWSFSAVPWEAVNAACVQRHCEPCGAQSQPWKPGTAMSQQETSTVPEPAGGKTYLQPGTCFFPSCNTSKHQGTTPDVTAADSQGSHLIRAWEEILLLAGQHHRTVWEKLKKVGRQEIKTQWAYPPN